MKQVEVQIMGQSYLLGCPEGGEERLQQAVRKVDAAMCKIRDAGKLRARDRIAVLAALNLAFELSEQEGGAAPPLPASERARSSHSTEPLTEDLQNLIGRLDQALAGDGQLI
jgi:cell division protein ZapA